MLRTALVENGYEVGTFTSPFIETFNERISLNVPISNDAIVELVSRIKPVSEMMERETDLGVATEFEIITAMMFYILVKYILLILSLLRLDWV